ncbi:MAG: hypothetical protein IPK12_19565 [Gemmatimonadetes bacterium]|nr:hypothetical protein [Gemmatimonadota bacterium]
MPAVLAKVSGDNQSATVGTGLAAVPTVRVEDQNGDPIAGVLVSFQVANGSGSVTGSAATTNASGIAAVGSWTMPTTAGSVQLAASVADLPAVIFSATATAGAPAALAFTAGPAVNAQAGVALVAQPAVRLEDLFGNPVPQAGVTVTATISAGGGSLTGATAQTNASGVAAFTTLTINGTPGARTLEFGASGVTPLSSPSIALTAGPAASVAAVGSTTLSGAVATQQLNVAMVLVQDGSGNPLPGVTVTYAVTAGGGTLLGATTQTDTQGQAQLGGWTPGTVAGVLNTVTATVTGLAPVTFSLTPVAQAPGWFAFVTPPPGVATTGAPLTTQPVLQTVDVYGNLAPLAGLQVAAGVFSGAGTVTAGGSAVTDANGIATFSGLTITGAPGPHVLGFGAAGFLQLNSGTIALNGGPPTTIAAGQGDGQTGDAGVALGLQPQVVVTDAQGNGVAGVAVTFAVTGGGGSVAGGNAITDADGVAGPASWTLGTTPGANTMTATAAGLAGSPVSFTATGVPGPAANLSLVTPPSAAAVNGVALATQPVVQLVDQFGNATPQAAVAVTADWLRGGTVLSGSAAAQTDAQGTATFGGITITDLVGSYTMTFSASGLQSISAPAISLSAGAATTIAASAGDNQSATVGTAVAVAPAVLVTDQSGNPVSGVAVDFAVASGGGSVTGASATSDASGIATVGSWTLGPAAGANTLEATSAGLTGSPVTFTATGAAVVTSQFTIDVVYLAGATPAQQAAFDAAKARWESIITGDLADVTVPPFSPPFTTTDCGASTSQPITGTVDDVRIYVELVPIDGTGNVLGSAGPCDLRSSGTRLPYVGIMKFDTADLATLEANGRLADVILHEMAHVLGYGVLWEPIPGFWPSNFLTGSCPLNTPAFTGAGSVAAYTGLNGGGGATSVPVEDSGTCNGSSGDGTRDSHWEESVFQSEVMTGFISGTVRPLSATTIRSIEDLGYVVDVSKADPFDIGTQPTLVRPGPVVQLQGDVLALPVWRVDPVTGRRKSQYSRP